MGHLHAGAGGQQFHRHVLWAAAAARTEMDVARFGPGLRDQLAECPGGRIGRYRDTEVVAGHARHRRQVFQRVVRQLRIQVRQHRQYRIVDEADGVAVRRGFGDALGADLARCAGLVLDHHVLSERGREFGREDARDVVHRGAGLQRHHHLDWPRGPGLRQGVHRCACQDGDGACEKSFHETLLHSMRSSFAAVLPRIRSRSSVLMAVRRSTVSTGASSPMSKQ